MTENTTHFLVIKNSKDGHEVSFKIPDNLIDIIYDFNGLEFDIEILRENRHSILDKGKITHD